MMEDNVLKFTFFRGRVALHAILKYLNVGKGDEVAIQAFTCVAVPEAVIASGARPLYIDIAPGSVNLDCNDLERKISSQTKAIVVQHTYGIPADMDKILDLGRKRNIPVIEDCCHTLFSRLNDKLLGTFGLASFYSYEWGKPVIAGIGGSARINDKEAEAALHKIYQEYSRPGFITDIKINMQYLAYQTLYRPSVYWLIKSLFHSLGNIGLIEGNYNPITSDQIADDFHLRMASSVEKRVRRKLVVAEMLSEKRILNGRFYEDYISGNNVSRVFVPENSKVVYARYPLFTQKKKAIIASAKERHIEISDWYDSIAHPLKIDDWKHIYYKPGDCPVSEKATTEIISLPTNEKTTQKDLEKITTFLNEFNE